MLSYVPLTTRTLGIMDGAMPLKILRYSDIDLLDLDLLADLINFSGLSAGTNPPEFAGGAVLGGLGRFGAPGARLAPNPRCQRPS